MAEVKGKGKEREREAHSGSTLSPLPNPPAGSANPAVSLSALWGYLQPALDHLVRSPTNDPNKAPSIDVEYHMGVHTATYNYFTAQAESASATFRAAAGERSMASGADLYKQLDSYMVDTVRELFLGAPQDDTALIQYIIPCFHRYSAGAQSVNRLLNYVNRHYVKRAIDEDKGWLRLEDVLKSVAKKITLTDSREKISIILRERKIEELKKWEYPDGGTRELLAEAEACAEAGSSPKRVVPLLSLAMRRFRTEFIEPLLAHKVGKAKAKKQTRSALFVSEPRGRLARAVKVLLAAEEGDAERDWLAVELAKTLKAVGIRVEHPVRMLLDKYVASVGNLQVRTVE